MSSRLKRPRNKRREKTFLEITYTDLEGLFHARRRTIQLWIARGLLDPTDILDIFDKYQHPEKLDRRRKSFPGGPSPLNTTTNTISTTPIEKGTDNEPLQNTDLSNESPTENFEIDSRNEETSSLSCCSENAPQSGENAASRPEVEMPYS
jgi:hypothetical protein